MPVRKVKGGYKWGDSPKEPTTKEHAREIEKAAYASGYKKKRK